MSTTVTENLSDLLPAMLPRLWAFSLRLSGNHHDAEDLLQRSCVRGLERTHQLRPGTAPLSWMFSIVQSMWINELKARGVRGRANVDWDDAVLAISDSAARLPEDIILSHEVAEAVGRLPHGQQMVMMLAIEGLSYAETAQALDVPIGTVMSRLSRARQSLIAWVGGRETITPRADRR